MTRADLIAAVLTKLGTLTLTGSPTVEEVTEDDYENNEGATFPHVGILLVKGGAGPLQEVGGPITYASTRSIDLYVSVDKHSDGVAILDELEAGLAGFCPDGQFPLEWANEEIVTASLGRFKWAQGWEHIVTLSR